MGRFFDEIHAAMAENGEMPAIEVDRRVIEHFNRNSLGGFDAVGYFVYQGVKVYEVGKREAAEERGRLSTEDVTFGKKTT